MTAITTAELDALFTETKGRLCGLSREGKRALCDSYADAAWSAEHEAKMARTTELRVMWLNEAARLWTQANACLFRACMERMEYEDAAARCRQSAEFSAQFVR